MAGEILDPHHFFTTPFLVDKPITRAANSFQSSISFANDIDNTHLGQMRFVLKITGSEVAYENSLLAQDFRDYLLENLMLVFLKREFLDDVFELQKIIGTSQRAICISFASLRLCGDLKR